MKSEEKPSTLEWARKYKDKGFSVIPLTPKGKIPAIVSWSEYQNRHATDEELKKWFGNDSKNNIAPEHYQDLKKSGLSDETILEAGIRSVIPGEINKKLGFDVYGPVSMYEIPFDDYHSRFRVFYEDGKDIDSKGNKKPRYLARKDSGNRLYIPSRTKQILNDVSVPIEITEGEKKALKACQEGAYCIGITGLWNWKVKDENILIPDFDQIALAGRTITINPDNDWLEPNRNGSKKNLKQAVKQLAYLLIDKGTKVFWRELPVMETREKVGLDDYLCGYSLDELKQLPLHQIRKLTIDEMLAGATPDDPDEIQEIIRRIASNNDDVERSLYVNKLCTKTGVSKRSVSNKIKELNKKDDKPTITDTDIIIAHPAYEINSNFLSLGFRETVVIGEIPTERNIYLIATDDSYILHEKPTFQLDDIKIVFEERDRLLINIRDRWDKSKLINFIKNPKVPKGLYTEIKQTLKEYVEFQREEHYGLITAWIMATYFSRLFHAFPFLFFYGKKQSGKSRVLDFLERITFNAMKIKGVSIASIADSIDGVRGTFLNDQAESLSDSRNVEILGILADSYTIGGGKRRIVNITNKSRKIVEFETYSPKAFASIKEIDADLKDRCVLIPMLRATKDYPYPEAYSRLWGRIRDKLYRLLLTTWQDVMVIYQTAGNGMVQRIKELWKPIETILRFECVPQEEIQAIRDAFLESMLETQSELSENEEELFEVLFEKLKDSKEGVFAVNEIAMNLKTDGNMTEKGIQTWTGRTISQLKLYDNHAGRKDYIDKCGKQKKGRAYSFSYTHVKDVYDRYHQTGGTGGNVVTDSPYQELTTNHLENKGGCEVVQVKDDTTSLPPLKDEAVLPKLLKNKDYDHLTTETTCLEDLKEIKSGRESTEGSKRKNKNEDIEVLEVLE